MNEQILNTPENKEPSSFLKNLKLIIPATMALFLTSCEETPDRAKAIHIALEKEPNKIEKIDPEKIQKAKEVFEIFKQQSPNVDVRINDSISALVMNDSTIRIQNSAPKGTTNEHKKYINGDADIYEYVFQKNGTTSLSWSSLEMVDIVSTMTHSSVEGKMEVDNTTGAIVYFLGGSAEYKILEKSEESKALRNPKVNPRGTILTNFLYDKGTAENFLDERLKDFDAIEMSLEKK